MMKSIIQPPIVVVSRADVRRIHTIKMLNEARIDHIVVTHNAAQRDDIKKVDTFKYSLFEISKTKLLNEKRNWIMKNLMPRDEWFIGMDDNIQYFTAVHDKWRSNARNNVQGQPPEGKTWRQIYNVRSSPRTWLQHFVEDIAAAQEEGAPFVGVATMENPFFRERRFSNFRFVKSKVFGLLNARDLTWKPPMSHDSYMTALVIARYGRVLVDNYLHHKTRMYEVGGLGTREQREKAGLMKYLGDTIKEFPGLVALGRGENTALRMCLTNEKSVQRWRIKHGYAK